MTHLLHKCSGIDWKGEEPRELEQGTFSENSFFSLSEEYNSFLSWKPCNEPHMSQFPCNSVPILLKNYSCATGSLQSPVCSRKQVWDLTQEKTVYGFKGILLRQVNKGRENAATIYRYFCMTWWHSQSWSTVALHRTCVSMLIGQRDGQRYGSILIHGQWLELWGLGRIRL